MVFSEIWSRTKSDSQIRTRHHTLQVVGLGLRGRDPDKVISLYKQGHVSPDLLTTSRTQTKRTNKGHYGSHYRVGFYRSTGTRSEVLNIDTTIHRFPLLPTSTFILSNTT